jgi:hypothetical protein
MAQGGGSRPELVTWVGVDNAAKVGGHSVGVARSAALFASREARHGPWLL